MLLNLVIKNSIKTLSIIGMAKNVGKTVVFNHLIKEAAQLGMLLGLTSLGRDGEKRDAVFFTPKPRIYAPLGSVIATAQTGLKNSDAKTEILERTGFSTALGEVVIARVTRPGYVELVGPVLLKQQKSIIEYLNKMGVDLIIIDGALDRVSSAVPSLSQGTVLATGAALAPTIEDALSKTKDRIEQFSFPQAENMASLQLNGKLLDDSKVLLVDKSERYRRLDAAGSLVGGDIIARAMTPDTKAVILTGAVGKDVLTKLTEAMAARGKLELVIRNGANLFCERRIWRGFLAKGGTISVLEPINLLAVTLNPTSPVSGGFDPEEFWETAKQRLAPYPVLDVVLGKGCLNQEGEEDAASGSEFKFN